MTWWEELEPGNNLHDLGKSLFSEFKLHEQNGERKENPASQGGYKHGEHMANSPSIPEDVLSRDLRVPSWRSSE